jgi:hypothetical protein
MLKVMGCVGTFFFWLQFGKDTAEFGGAAQQNQATPAPTEQQQSSWCTIM